MTTERQVVRKIREQIAPFFKMRLLPQLLGYHLITSNYSDGLTSDLYIEGVERYEKPVIELWCFEGNSSCPFSGFIIKTLKQELKG